MILAFLLLIPMAGAAAAGMARNRRTMELANLAAFGGGFALSLALAGQVLRGGAVSLWNSFLYADGISALVVLLTSFAALASAVYAVGYLRRDEQSGMFADEEDPAAALRKLRHYYALTPLFVFSMLLMALANNLGVMWVAIEATTLASVFLVSFYGKHTSLEAAWKYAIIGGVGLSMALFGTILLYYAGHRLLGADTLAGLNWSVLVQRASQLDPAAVRLAFILALLGYGTKAGIAPMHTWKPDAYSEAPVPAAAILSTAMTNCAIYGIIRFYILTRGCLGPDFPGGFLLLLGLLSMGIAVPFVLLQKNLRRLLAYSTIDHAGIMATALGIGGVFGARGLMLHMTFHTVAKSLLFLCAGSVQQHFGTDLLARIKGGVLKTLPLTGAVFLMSILAVAGLPPFGLFQSEFLILRGAIARDNIVAGVLFVVFSTAIFAGVLIHAVRLVLGGAADGTAPRQAVRRPWRDSAIAGMAAVMVITGVWLPAPFLDLITAAARVLTGE